MIRQLCCEHHITEFNALPNSRRHEASSWITVAREDCAECKRLAELQPALDAQRIEELVAEVERLQTEHRAKSQGHWIGPVEAAGLRRRLKHAEDIRDFWIKEHDDLLQTIRHERRLRQEAELAAHIHDKSCGELAQTVHTDRARRREAEREREAWSEMARDRGTRLRIAEQRAERAEGLAASTREAAEWLWGFWDGNTLVARPGYEDDIREAWGRLLAATDGAEATNLLDRLERAEALAQLVNEEMAALLERLGTAWTATLPDDGDIALALAAQIREVLDDSQA